MPVDGNYYHVVFRTLCPQAVKATADIDRLDETGHVCALQMPYGLSDKADIPDIYRGGYFCIDTGNQTMFFAG